MRNVLVICGGMGPYASLLFHEKLLENMTSVTYGKGDASYLNIIHLSFPSEISDRTKYIQNNGSNEDDNPGVEAAEILRPIIQAYKQTNVKLIIGVPCNTFHSQIIFNKFEECVENCSRNMLNVTIVNMVTETIGNIIRIRSNKVIGIIGTEGTLNSKLYENLLKFNNLNVVIPSNKTNKLVNDCIYNDEWGLKSVTPPSNNVINILKLCVDELYDGGANIIIMGCTDLPLAFKHIKNYFNIKMIDPMDSLATAMIRKCITTSLD